MILCIVNVNKKTQAKVATTFMAKITNFVSKSKAKD